MSRVQGIPPVEDPSMYRQRVVLPQARVVPDANLGAAAPTP
ncbi:hypothetical protein [Streptomyces guryensis]|nr:hypothetical protein [Streptomyces guryensis]